MVKGKLPIGQDRTKWHAGQRVIRMDSSEQGTVTEADGHVKVLWDRGRTSYYDRGVPSNVELVPSTKEA
jgi:hypothetical protein